MEHPKGASGQETDSHGIPWSEIHTREEIHHLEFEKWLLEKHPEDNTPIEPNPFPPQVKVIDTKNPGNLGDFFETRRRLRKNKFHEPGI